MPDPALIAGLALARRFYRNVVEPVIRSERPEFEHTAGLIGPGSEVLGFDTEMSRDHDWGPRVLVFHSAARQRDAEYLKERLATRLPESFLGYSTHFGAPDLADGGTRALARPNANEPISHGVEFHVPQNFLRG